MSFARVLPQHFEVTYETPADLEPERQAALLTELEQALATGPVSVLFVVRTLEVPRAVPEFWFSVTQRLAPRLCAMAIVSDSLAVRAAASGFSVTNRVRKVKVGVKAFTPPELEAARRWCSAAREPVAVAQ